LAFFGDEYRLTKKGKLMADYITSEFFWSLIFRKRLKSKRLSILPDLKLQFFF
jgi:hypothetical protein